ncbi:MAG TPA: GIY-YIG nuclease family protein [Pirellulales bacterium]|jgi:excinuclease ABC subunit C|nr:GIY-YIG nuclease family protein [Pirellulales bacterium]
MLSLETNGFSGFGRSALWARSRAKLGSVELETDARQSRRTLRRLCPARPGVYGMIDSEGALIYVGKAKSLRHRLLTYLQTEPADSKAARIIEHAERLVWEPAAHELIALARELELIRRWRPEFNVLGQPGRFRRCYVCLGRGPAPYAYVAPQPNDRTERAFGPVPSRQRLLDAVRQVNKWFRLRDCPERVAMVFADQLELFSADRRPQCTRFELGTCPAPCAAGCTSRDYLANLAAANGFLAGTNVGLLEQLERDMLAAAKGCEFERAANLRDAWQPLAWLHDHLGRLRQARGEFSFVYPVTSATGRENWLVVDRAHLVDVFRAPRDCASAERCLLRLTRAFGPRERSTDGPRKEDAEHMLLVLTWFRRHADEFGRTIPLNRAKAICRRLAEIRRAG